MQHCVTFFPVSIFQTVASDDNDGGGGGGDYRTSLRTFLLYYLLRPQTATNTAASTAAPTNNVSTNVLLQNNSNISQVTISITRKLRLTQLNEEDDESPTQFDVPAQYYGMFRSMVDTFRQRINNMPADVDPTDDAEV